MHNQLRRPIYGLVFLMCLSFGGFKIYKAVSSFIERKTDGFSVQAISSNRKYHPDWDVHSLTEEERAELDCALGQKYQYLACGNQAFAFLSEDGRYVLKFFKQKLFEPPFIWKWVSLFDGKGRRAKKIWKKQDKLERDFASYRIAFDDLKEETGLVFVHLNATEWIGKEVIVSDKSQAEHALVLDRLNFILQRRADLVYPTIDRLMAEGHVAEAKEALSSILKLFASRCGKGIADSDPDLDKNFGFIDGRAVQIDIGRFTRDPVKRKFRDRHVAKSDEPAAVELPPIKESFKAWLSKNYPELYEHFDREYEGLKATL